MSIKLERLSLDIRKSDRKKKLQSFHNKVREGFQIDQEINEGLKAEKMI
jgi:hypothetical protein